MDAIELVLRCSTIHLSKDTSELWTIMSTTNIAGRPIALSKEQIPQQIDLLISLHLGLWPALTLAIQNGWGTSSPQIGNDKRDWLAGAISDLFATNQLRDVEDLEDVLEQVMSDEFEVVVDDGTLEEVAQAIWKGRERVLDGDGGEVKVLLDLWEKKKGKSVVATAGAEVNQETDDEADEEDNEWNGFGNHNRQTDVDMDEAPALVDTTKPTKMKPVPEVDEDGFTKVVSKKKR